MGNYDFSIKDVNENTLYFKFIRRGKGGVKVCSPGRLKKDEYGKCIHAPYKYEEKPLGEVVIPASVEVLGYRYFVKEIDNHAFYACYEITRVALPETITKIGDDAFYRCIKLEKVNIPNRVKIIGNCAFQKCELLKDLFLPEGLESLGSSACDGCKSLREVKIPNVLTWITGYTFNDCVALETINVPMMLGGIGRSAFANCVGLREFEIPSSIFRVTAGAFEGCNIKFRSLSDEYVVKEDCLYRVRKNGYELLYVPNDVVELVLPRGVLVIGERAFCGCNKLKKVKLPNTIVFISRFGFSGCSSLEEVDIPEDSSLAEIGGGAFAFCSKLKKLTLPSPLMRISRGAFFYCSVNIVNKSNNFVIRDNGLYTVDYKRLIYVLPDAVKFRVRDEVEKIDPCAFNGCEKLIFLILPRTFNEIPHLGFAFRNVVNCIYTLNPIMETTCYDKGFHGGQIPVRRINEYEAAKLMSIM